MRTSLVLLLLLVPSIASAQDPHPRRARAMRFTSTTPAVMVAGDRAWIPDDGASDPPLSACAGARCAPVVAVERCEAPRCPGTGTVAVLASSIASVGGYPTDRDGFERERSAISSDAELAAIAGYFAYHPEPAPQPRGPVRWRADDAEDVRWELSAAVAASYLADTDVGTGQLVLGGGPRFHVDWGSNSDDDFLGFVFGTSLGGDLRVHVIPRLRGQAFDQYAVAVGVAPTFANEPEDEIVRLPAVYALLIPEVGLIADGVGDAVFYFEWSASAALLLDEHVGVELRASAMIVDDWAEGDAVEAILSLSAALVLR